MLSIAILLQAQECLELRRRHAELPLTHHCLSLYRFLYAQFLHNQILGQPLIRGCAHASLGRVRRVPARAHHQSPSIRGWLSQLQPHPRDWLPPSITKYGALRRRAHLTTPSAIALWKLSTWTFWLTPRPLPGPRTFALGHSSTCAGSGLTSPLYPWSYMPSARWPRR